MSSTTANRRPRRLAAFVTTFLFALPAALASPVAAQQIAPVPLAPAVAAIAAPILAIAPTALLPPPVASAPPLIVVGFAGGFITSTSAVHGEISLALHLRQRFGAAIHPEIFANHHGDDAHRAVLRIIDLSTPATPAINRRNARVILYGHSWGASEADDLARLLQHDGVRVLLLVQVDGVKKHPHDDSIIPANVATAINFYQTDGLLHGRPLITAADPAATRILGNIHLSYRNRNVPTPGYPWFARIFTHRHIEIENDPRVWGRVEDMVANAMVPSNPSAN